MTTPYIIPLTPAPQKFYVSLLGVVYRFTVKYQDSYTAGWVLDIANESDEPIIGGIPLVTGANLLAQYEYLGIGVPLYVATDGNLDAVPTFTNLGLQCKLYFTTTP